MFEKTTFLVVSHCLKREHSDLQRFEKISNIIKQFKLNCSKFDTSFQSIEIKNSNYTIIIDLFTPNTYIMVIISDQNISNFVISFFLSIFEYSCLNGGLNFSPGSNKLQYKIRSKAFRELGDNDMLI